MQAMRARVVQHSEHACARLGRGNRRLVLRAHLRPQRVAVEHTIADALLQRLVRIEGADRPHTRHPFMQRQLGSMFTIDLLPDVKLRSFGVQDGAVEIEDQCAYHRTLLSRMI